MTVEHTDPGEDAMCVIASRNLADAPIGRYGAGRSPYNQRLANGEAVTPPKTCWKTMADECGDIPRMRSNIGVPCGFAQRSAV